MTYDGASPEALAARLGVETLTYVEQVGSTLDLVHDLARQQLHHGAVVLADEQTAGRGRHGRAWHSPKGCGIWLGYLHRLRDRNPGGVLSLRVGVAVARALTALGVPAMVKWPNDVLVTDRKVAGVLCEARHDDEDAWVAVGIGMNVHGPLPASLRTVAATIDEYVPDVTRIGVLEVLLPLLGKVEASRRLAEAETAELDALDWLRGRTLAGPVAGIACGIDAEGALLVEAPGGVQSVVAGTVTLG